MEPLHCHITAMTDADREQVVLLAEEVLRPLATAAGHPERYDTDQLLDMVERADVYVAHAEDAEGEVAGFVALDLDPDDTLAVRCVCVAPAFEAQRVAHQLLDWAEGVAYEAGRLRLRAVIPAADGPSRHLYRAHEFVALADSAEPELLVLEKRLPERP